LILTDGRLDFENQSSYTVVVRVTDSALNTFDQTITVTVNDLNEAPRVQLQNVVSSIAENALTETSLKLADIAMEDDAAGVNILSLSGRNAGDFEIVGRTELHLRAGTALDYENQTSLEVNITVHDMTLGLATQDTVSFTLLLADVDEPPQAADDTYSASSNTVVIVAPGVLANDVDPEGAPLALTVLTPPSHGVLTVGPDGSFTYVPDAGFFGTDSFVYHLNDGSTVSNPATVKLLIQVPLANPSLTSTIETDKNNENGRQDTNDSNDQTPLIPMTGVDIESVSKAETQIDRPLTGDIAEEDDQSRVTVLTVQAETPDSGPAVRPLVQLLTRTNDIVRSVATATVPPSVVASSYNFNVAHAFVDVLNELRDEVAVDNLLKQTVIGSSMVVSTSLSIGYVIWLIRGGVLLSSVLSSLPAWQVMDPLPVLGFIDDEDEENMEDDSLESLVAKSNSDRQETEQQ
jgi:hypothetical protein